MAAIAIGRFHQLLGPLPVSRALENPVTVRPVKPLRNYPKLARGMAPT